MTYATTMDILIISYPNYVLPDDSRISLDYSYDIFVVRVMREFKKKNGFILT